MSLKLAELLNKPETLVKVAITKLEELNGYPSEDVRLLAENRQKLRVKLQQLGLDPDDTTQEELYHALKIRFSEDARHLDKTLGVTSAIDLNQRLSAAAQLVEHCGNLTEAWVLKHSAAKKILKSQLPKKTMKQLGYRSIESFLKRENINQVYLAVQQIESEAWQRLFDKKLSKLNSTDFEMRQLQITTLEPKRYAATQTNGAKAIFNRTIGTVAVWPSSVPANTTVLTLSVYILKAIDFMGAGDLTDNLCRMNPGLWWWSDASQLLVAKDGKTVSFNIKDAVFNDLNNRSYGAQSSHWGRKALLEDLVNRYHRQPSRLQELLSEIGYNLSSKLDAGMSMPMGARLAAEYSVAGN